MTVYLSSVDILYNEGSIDILNFENRKGMTFKSHSYFLFGKDRFHTFQLIHQYLLWVENIEPYESFWVLLH